MQQPAPALRAARAQHRRSSRRVAREELARRSIGLDRAQAGLPRQAPYGTARRAVHAGAPPVHRASRAGLGEVGLQEAAALERAERGREYDASTASRRSQVARTAGFQTQVALEQAAADARARIEELRFELAKREQQAREATRCTLRLGQTGRDNTRPELQLEVPLRVRHGTTVEALIAAASSPSLVSRTERDYLERNTGILFEAGAPCCAIPLQFGTPRFSLREIRRDGTVRPLASHDASGCERTLDDNGICDGAVLLLEPA
jgi:hypothetical protein